MYYRYVELFATKSYNPHFWRWYLYYLGPLTFVAVASPLEKTLILECSKFNCHLFRIFAHSAKIGFLYFHFSRYVKYRICLTAFTPTCQSKNKYNFPIYLLQRSQLPTNLSWFYLKCQFNHTRAWAKTEEETSRGRGICLGGMMFFRGGGGYNPAIYLG